MGGDGFGAVCVSTRRSKLLGQPSSCSNPNRAGPPSFSIPTHPPGGTPHAATAWRADTSHRVRCGPPVCVFVRVLLAIVEVVIEPEEPGSFRAAQESPPSFRVSSSCCCCSSRDAFVVGESMQLPTGTLCAVLVNGPQPVRPAENRKAAPGKAGPGLWLLELVRRVDLQHPNGLDAVRRSAAR